MLACFCHDAHPIPEKNEFEEDGEKQIRFKFVDHEGNEHEITRPLVDTVTVTQASGEQTRYVVEMGLCVGDYY